MSATTECRRQAPELTQTRNFFEVRKSSRLQALEGGAAALILLRCEVTGSQTDWLTVQGANKHETGLTDAHCDDGDYYKRDTVIAQIKDSDWWQWWSQYGESPWRSCTAVHQIFFLYSTIFRTQSHVVAAGLFEFPSSRTYKKFQLMQSTTSNDMCPAIDVHICVDVRNISFTGHQ